jgi:hypothetical protein
VLQHLPGLLLHLVRAQAQGHAGIAAGAVEAIDVLAKLEGPPAEGAGRVIDGIAVLNAPVEHRDHRLALRDESTVQIDHALLHASLLWRGPSCASAQRRQSRPAGASAVKAAHIVAEQASWREEVTR